MKPFLIATSLIFALSTMTSCKQAGQFFGKKEDERQKLEEIAAKAAELLAAQQKKEAEEKAKLEEQIEAEVQKRLAEKAAETQPTAEKPVEKVIIIKEKAASGREVAAAKPSAGSGYVRLYDDKGFTDRILTVRFGRDIGNMHYVSSDDGKSGFNDKASSARYSIPDGWQALLYENNNYSKRGYALTGSGSIADMGYFSDKCSSLRWEKK